MNKFWCVYVADVYQGEICHQYFKSKDEAQLYKINMEEESGDIGWLKVRECSFRD